VLEGVGEGGLEGGGGKGPGRLDSVDVARHDHAGDQALHHRAAPEAVARAAEGRGQRRRLLGFQFGAQELVAALVRERGADQHEPRVVFRHVLPAVHVCPGDPGAHALNVPQEGVLRDLEAADGLHEQGFLAAEIGDDEGMVHVRLGGYRPD
jgi:hypothetical protein